MNRTAASPHCQDKESLEPDRTKKSQISQGQIEITQTGEQQRPYWVGKASAGEARSTIALVCSNNMSATVSVLLISKSLQKPKPQRQNDQLSFD